MRRVSRMKREGRREGKGMIGAKVGHITIHNLCGSVLVTQVRPHGFAFLIQMPRKSKLPRRAKD